jgi:hypothetical protein
MGGASWKIVFLDIFTENQEYSLVFKRLILSSACMWQDLGFRFVV